MESRDAVQGMPGRFNQQNGYRGDNRSG